MKTYLYVYNNNQYIEIIFEKDEFKHLTGISTKLNPKDFYKNILKKEDKFTTNKPKDLCRLKLSELKNISNITNSLSIHLIELVQLLIIWLLVI
ncbi:PBECR4 domain-containing protein [Dielma fastidiosa]|uniref:PBECR4 domain-containing protein n=1 Tax=Dielma fastidiosa TaxID=1034346 RepID=UPI00137901DF